jgi:hypothetical protein
MAFSVSVIVRDFDIQCVATEPGEANAPLLIDADAVVAFSIALEELELIGHRDRQILEVVCSVQLLQLHKRSFLDFPGELFGKFLVPDLGFK